MATASAIITVRLEPKLLSALKARAREEGRSVSAEVVQLIRRAVAAHPTGDSGARTMGMFEDMDFDPIEVEEVRDVRRDAAAAIKRRHTTRRKRA
jgi:hypothetical protein